MEVVIGRYKVKGSLCFGFFPFVFKKKVICLLTGRIHWNKNLILALGVESWRGLEGTNPRHKEEQTQSGDVCSSQ